MVGGLMLMVAPAADSGFGIGDCVRNWVACAAVGAVKAPTIPGAVVSGAANSALDSVEASVLQGVGKAIASVGTMWVNIGAPPITDGAGVSGATPGTTGAGAAGVNTVLGYITWIALGICVLSLIALGARMGFGRRMGAERVGGALGVVLMATMLISGSVAVVTKIAPAVSSKDAPAVGFIQDSLYWYMIAFAVVGVIVGAAKMAWEQRAEPGRDLVRSLMTLVVVSGTGTLVISLLTSAGDGFAVWLLTNSLKCPVDGTGSCFANNLGAMLALTAKTPAAPLGAVLVIIMGLGAIIGSVVQILLMIARGGILVVLAGALPISAAATNTEVGRAWFRKFVAWIMAFILYKPAAAIIYAAGFKLAGSDIFKDDGSGLISILTGLTLLALALLALPALMSLVVPAVSAMGGGGAGAGAAMAGMAALPTGAAAAGRLFGGQGGGSSPAASPSGAGSSGPSGTNGSAGSSGPSGSPGSSGTSGPASSNPGGASGPGGSNGSGAGSSSGAAARSGGGPAGAKPAASAAGTGGGAAGAGAAGGGAAASSGATAAGAAGGPAGMAVAAGVSAAANGAKAVTTAAKGAAESNTGGTNA